MFLHNLKATIGGGNANGESITYQFAKGTPAMTTIEIFKGYMKSEHAWKDNARVRKLKMYLNNKPYAILNLKDVTSKLKKAYLSRLYTYIRISS